MSEQEHQETPNEHEADLDLDDFKNSLDRHIAVMQADQSVSGAVIFGGIAAILGALLWATLVVTTDSRFGIAALGLAYLVGIAVRKGGKGITTKFNIIGAALSLFSLILGEYVKGIVFTSRIKDSTYLEAAYDFSTNYGLHFMLVSLRPMDFLFFAIACYFGYRFSTKF